MRSFLLIIPAALFFCACEGRRALDNPDNLDNMPVEAETVEDTAGIHSTPLPEYESTTTTESAITTGPAEMP